MRESGAMSEDLEQTPELELAAESLRCDFHLACVAGPDCGMVVPLVAGFALGRQTLQGSDRYMSRLHAQVTDAPKLDGRPFGLGASRQAVGGLRPLEPSNPLSSGKEDLPLIAGETVKVGSGFWQVRARPMDLGWPTQEVNTQTGGWLRLSAFVMPVLLLFMLSRWLPSAALPIVLAGALLAVGVGLLFWLNRFRRCDEARLLQAAEASRGASESQKPSEGDATRSAVKVLRYPRRPRRLILRPGVTGTVGECAENYAQWLVLQIRSAGRPAGLVGPNDRAGDETHPLGVPLADASYTIAWAQRASQLPVSTMRVVPSRCVGSAGWVRQAQHSDGGSKLPDLVPLTELIGPPDATSVAERWERQDTPVVGVDIKGPVSFDLVKDGPHALVAGGTGSGKSEFLTTVVLSYAASYPPSLLRFVFIDYKGGAGLDHLAGLPHVEHSMTDLDATRTPWLLRALGAVLRARKVEAARLSVRSWEDWEDTWRRGEATAPPPRLVIVADEFRVLADSHPELMAELTNITTQGRSLGMHLIVSTQRPGGAVSANMRATLDARFALRCSEPADSIETIGTRQAADLPRIPGRSVFDGRQLQAAYVEDAKPWTAAIANATESDWPRLYGEHGEQVARPLPSTIPFPSDTDLLGTVGYAEDPVDCELFSFQHPSAATAFIGPPSHASELLELALAVSLASPTRKSSGQEPTASDFRRSIWLGDYPQSSEARALRRSFTTIIPRDDLGRHVRALSGLVQYEGDPITVVISEVSGLARDLELATGGREAASLLRKLIREANSNRHNVLRLILTDSRPASLIEEVPHRLIRLASPSTLISPNLLPLLPQALGSPASQLSNYVSPNWGRVIHSSPDSPEPTWLQIYSLPSVREAPLADATDFLELENPELFDYLDRLSTTSGCPPELLVLAPASHRDHLLERLHRAFPSTSISWESPDQWLKLTSATGTALLVEPTREALRSVSSRFPSAQLELAACFPLPATSALYLGEDHIQFLTCITLANAAV